MRRTFSSTSILSIFPGFRVGGAQVRFAAVANHLRQDARFSLVSMDGSRDCTTHLDSDLDFTMIDLTNNKGNMLDNRRRFRNFLRSECPDLLVTHNWGSIDWAIANWPHIVRHIHIEDGFGPEEADRQLPRRAWVRRLALRNSTVVVPSRQLQKIALDAWRLRPASVAYVPNGIDIARFSSPETVSILPQKSLPLIGTVAALRREKNLPRLLEAFRIVRAHQPCQLIIAGDGTERESLERKVFELGLERDVTFTGYRSDTERVYAALDVFALSSDTEQMPTSVLEAMAAGLPIASTDVGDVRAMVARENVPFVVSKDAATLASALLALLQDVGLRKRVGAANQAVARRDFSQDKMFAAYETLFLGKGAQPAE